MNISASITTIPPRYKSRDLFKCIDSLLNQSLELTKIYINIPKEYKRFDNFTNKQINKIKKYNSKIKITFYDFDSPLLKYMAPANDNEYLFIGDDDQEYNKNLIENMFNSIFDNSAVYQNRYHTVKTGTAGIIHGFVGLILQKKLLNNIFNYYDGSELWVDDQFMSIYFFKENIKIYPTIINDFDDIYINNAKCEKLGVGGDLCLDPITGKRNKQIRELEKKFNVFFLKKNNPNSKGNLINFNWKNNKIKKIIHYVVLDNFTKEIKNNLETLIKKYSDEFEFNLINKEYYFEKYNMFNLKYIPYNYINFYSDFIGIQFVNNEGGIYINRNYLVDDNFDIYELLLNNESKFNKNNCLYYVKH